MVELLDLKEMEKKAYKSFFDDGIWDIYLGLLLLCLGCMMWLQMSDFGNPTVILIVLEMLALGFFIIGKKKITVPRLGNVKFGEKRRKKNVKVALTLGISVLAGLLLMMYASGGTASIEFIVIFWAANCLAVFFVMAHYFDYSGFYLAGIMYAISIPSLELVNNQMASYKYDYLHLMLPALILIIFGASKLIRFIGKYEKMEEIAV